MAARAAEDFTSTSPILERFHPNCGRGITLSENRRVAHGDSHSALRIAFSNDPIANGLKFSVKILQKGSAWDLGIGVTTNSPDEGPLPYCWSDISSSDQYWYILIRSGDCLVYHNGQERKQWDVDRSAGNSVSCALSENGKLHLYNNGEDVGVAGAGLPTDQPLWGFVLLRGDWIVRANYVIPKGHPQDYAGKTFHFVERPPEGLICAVCQALAHDPVQANCCGKIYCTRCIEKWKTRSNSCPTCRSTEQSDPPFNVFPDKRAYQDIRRLSVHCPNMCDKKMELCEVQGHLISDNGCPFHVVDCGNKCGDGVCRTYIDEHMTSMCRLRSAKCLYCPLVSTFEQIWTAHRDECPNYPLDCPNECGAWDITRSTVPTHREVCPLEPVECEYKRFGCAVVVPRKDIAEHLKTSVQDHLQMTPRRVEEQDVRLHEQEVHLKEQEVRLKEQEVRLQEQEVCLQEEKAERQLMEVRLKDMEEKEERAERERTELEESVKLERQRMNEAIAHGVKQLEDRAEEQETQLKEERAERQLIEARLQDVEAKLACFIARLS